MNNIHCVFEIIGELYTYIQDLSIDYEYIQTDIRFFWIFNRYIDPFRGRYWMKFTSPAEKIVDKPGLPTEMQENQGLRMAQMLRIWPSSSAYVHSFSEFMRLLGSLTRKPSSSTPVRTM